MSAFIGLFPATSVNELLEQNAAVREMAINTILMYSHKTFNVDDWHKFKTPVKLTTREWCKHRHNYLYLRFFVCMYDGTIECELHREYHPDLVCEINIESLPTEDLLTIVKALGEIKLNPNA